VTLDLNKYTMLRDERGRFTSRPDLEVFKEAFPELVENVPVRRLWRAIQIREPGGAWKEYEPNERCVP
jgi:hypothetical protein